MHDWKLTLMSHFLNEQRDFDNNPLKEKFKFMPEEDAVLKIYLDRLGGETFSLDEKISDSNLTKGGGRQFIQITLIFS